MKTNCDRFSVLDRESDRSPGLAGWGPASPGPPAIVSALSDEASTGWQYTTPAVAGRGPLGLQRDAALEWGGARGRGGCCRLRDCARRRKGHGHRARLEHTSAPGSQAVATGRTAPPSSRRSDDVKLAPDWLQAIFPLCYRVLSPRLSVRRSGERIHPAQPSEASKVGSLGRATHHAVLDGESRRGPRSVFSHSPAPLAIEQRTQTPPYAGPGSVTHAAGAPSQFVPTIPRG